MPRHSSHVMGAPVLRDLRFATPYRATCAGCGGREDTGPDAAGTGLTVWDVTLSRPCGAPPDQLATVPVDIWGRATSGKRYVVTAAGSEVALFVGPTGWGEPEREGQLWMVLPGSAPGVGAVVPDYEEA